MKQHRPPMSQAFALAASALLCAAAPSAAAQSAAPRAAALSAAPQADAASGPGGVSRAAAGADESWLRFQSGKRLFEERRFGEALNAFEDAAALRRDRFAWAQGRLDGVLSGEEARAAKDYLPALVDSLAKRDLIERDYAQVKKASGGSLRREAELLRQRRLSDGFAGFLDALVLVLDHRPAESLGGSIAKLRSAAAELSSYPEAEYWIGRVYLAEGELRLAELQFRKAYDQRESLDIPEDRFQILDALAGVYRDGGKWRDYEESLKEIVAADPAFSEKSRFFRDAMERSVRRDGIDKFMTLYRVEGGAWTKAGAELGSFYLANGRPQALVHLALAANGLLARCIERVREREPSYAYTSLRELLGRIDADRELRRYAEEAKLYRCLYELGEALAAEGERDSARGIWAALAGRDTAAPWDRRSAEALARAFR